MCGGAGLGSEISTVTHTWEDMETEVVSEGGGGVPACPPGTFVGRSGILGIRPPRPPFLSMPHSVQGSVRSIQPELQGQGETEREIHGHNSPVV